MTPEQVEREYNNRAHVPEHPKFFERWERDSDFARRTLKGRIDLAYGPHQRHRIDLFPAKEERGLLVFIHGGYWRALDKKSFAWLAPPFVAAGLSVANVNYRLCPEVRIRDIMDDAVEATNWLFEQGIAKQRVALTGHSAGGHLVAAIFASKSLRFDPERIVGGVPISGVFDLTPLTLASMNADLKLGDAEALHVSLMQAKRSIAAPVIVAAGGGETNEFQRQSRDFAAAWAPQARECLIPAGYNHFSILDAFIERGQRLHQATLELFSV
jgi:arylformamidase